MAPVGDLDQVIVRMAPGLIPPADPGAGTAVYAGIEGDITVTGLTPGATYSFAGWVRDRHHATGPQRTVTGLGTAVTLAVGSGTSGVGTGSTLAFTGALTVSNGSAAGRPVTLVGSCRGGDVRFVAATATSGAAGALAVTVVQTMPSCYYRWEVLDGPSLRGAASGVVQVDASIPVPPDGTPPRSR